LPNGMDIEQGPCQLNNGIKGAFRWFSEENPTVSGNPFSDFGNPIRQTEDTSPIAAYTGGPLVMRRVRLYL